MSSHQHLFKTQASLIEALTQSILQQLQHAIESRGFATLLVSGGTTPKPLFEALRKQPFAWEKVTVGLCDERWVDVTHEASNEHFVKQHLLQEEAESAHFIGMFEQLTSIEQAQKICSDKIATHFSPIDVLLLGMGEDAHTASLFPNNVKLSEAFDLNNNEKCIAIEPSGAPYMRMSLTLSAILSAAHIYVHFEGGRKREVFKKALEGVDCYAMPIRSILQQNKKNVEVFYR